MTIKVNSFISEIFENYMHINSSSNITIKTGLHIADFPLLCNLNIPKKY